MSDIDADDLTAILLTLTRIAVAVTLPEDERPERDYLSAA